MLLLQDFFIVNLIPLYGPLFRHGGRNFDTHALFCKKDADNCKHVILRYPPFTNDKGSNFSSADLSEVGHEVKWC